MSSNAWWPEAIRSGANHLVIAMVPRYSRGLRKASLAIFSGLWCCNISTKCIFELRANNIRDHVTNGGNRLAAQRAFQPDAPEGVVRLQKRWLSLPRYWKKKKHHNSRSREIAVFQQCFRSYNFWSCIIDKTFDSLCYSPPPIQARKKKSFVFLPLVCIVLSRPSLQRR